MLVSSAVRCTRVVSATAALSSRSVANRSLVPSALARSVNLVPHPGLHTPVAVMSSPANAAGNVASTQQSASDLWHPAQYLLFDEIRARPGQEMIARVESTLRTYGQSTATVRRVVDLGCGTGKLALQLAAKFSEAEVMGVDTSANMLEDAAKATSQQDASVQQRVSWKQAGFEQFTAPTPDGVDIIFSNAALHWLPKLHETLFPHLMSQLKKPGGILAVQMPNNFRAPSHLLMLQALKDGGFFTPAELEAVWSKQPDIHVDGASYYFHLLRQHARSVDTWQVEYGQVISSPTQYHPVAEWTKSTALAPILAALPSDEARTRFQEIYSALLEKAYPYFENAEGQRQVLFNFKRVFIVAVR